MFANFTTFVAMTRHDSVLHKHVSFQKTSSNSNPSVYSIKVFNSDAVPIVYDAFLKIETKTNTIKTASNKIASICFLHWTQIHMIGHG